MRRYVRNQYGTTTSHLHGSLPTDRCVAEWWIESPRVEALLNGGPPVARPETVERIRAQLNAQRRPRQSLCQLQSPATDSNR